jgi:hypothetical protein
LWDLWDLWDSWEEEVVEVVVNGLIDFALLHHYLSLRTPHSALRTQHSAFSTPLLPFAICFSGEYFVIFRI